MRYGYLKTTRCSEDSIMIGKHGSTWDNAIWNSFQIKWKGNLRFLEKKCHNFRLTTPFCMNENFFVIYDFRKLHKKLELKIIEYGYVRGCPKKPMIQIGFFKILGVAQNKLVAGRSYKM